MSEELKTIVYEYLFNYFEGDTFQGYVVGGAAIYLAIRIYKDGKEVKFKENKEPLFFIVPDSKGTEPIQCYLCDTYSVSFDREQLFVVRKNEDVCQTFCRFLDCDSIEADVVGYSLDRIGKLHEGLDEEKAKSLSEGAREIPCLFPTRVSEEDFRTFLANHADDFDIPDNTVAQVPGVVWENVQKSEEST